MKVYLATTKDNDFRITQKIFIDKHKALDYVTAICKKDSFLNENPFVLKSVVEFAVREHEVEE